MATKKTSSKSTNSTKKAKKALDINEVIKDPICQKWVNYCLLHDDNAPVSLIKEKTDFYHKNQAHLKKNGLLFENSESLQRALDTLESNIIGDLEGCLLHIKVGSESRAASIDELSALERDINDFIKDKIGITVLVSDHSVSIEKYNLPQLRKLTSKVIGSNDPSETNKVLTQVEI